VAAVDEHILSNKQSETIFLREPAKIKIRKSTADFEPRAVEG
jgi:hypothetical protein